MSKRIKDHPAPAGQQHTAAIPVHERTELQRQGAKAAARGDQAAANPMDQPVNEPERTGESAQTWSQRREAWQAGYEAQARTPSAPTANPKGEAGHHESE